MLSCGKMLPLRDDGGIGFEIQVGLAFFYLAVAKHPRDTVNEDGVDARILIFGTDGDQTEVNDLRSFGERKQAKKCRVLTSSKAQH